MLMAGRNKELFKTLVRGARVRSPDGAATVNDALEDAGVVTEEGYTLPWEALNDLVKLRWGELWSIGGGVGCGKTLLAHAIAAHFIAIHSVATAMFMLRGMDWKTLINVSTLAYRYQDGRI